MTYLGNTPTTQSFISGTDYFNGTGSQTAFTLSRTVASINDIQVVVNNVVQQPNDAYTLSGTTLTMTSAPSAGTNNVYVRYLSTTTQAITPSQNTVSWNTLDSNTQQDLGLMYKNKIINGNMVIDQRNAGAEINPAVNNTYSVDRWNTNSSSANIYKIQQNAGSVTPPVGFTNYLGVTTVNTISVSGTNSFTLNQRIEGFNVADLGWGTANAKTVTLSFWVRSSLTGTFGGALGNGSLNRSYPYSYTISAANTWEYKTVTIPGDTTGTWATGNTTGIFLWFGMGVGGTLSGSAGAWAGSDFRSATGAVSVVGTNGATWYLTGVQLEVGTQATAFSTAGGSYGAELQLCQRYFQINKRISGVTADTTTVNCNLIYYCTMRTAPTLGQQGVIQINDNGVNSTQSSTSITSLNSDNEGTFAQLGNFSGLTANRPAIFRLNANTNGITLSAEL